MAVHHHRETGQQNGEQHEQRKKVGATKLKFFGWLADTYPLPSPPNQKPAATPGSDVAARVGATAVGPPGCRGRWPRVPPPLARCGRPCRAELGGCIALEYGTNRGLETPAVTYGLVFHSQKRPKLAAWTTGSGVLFDRKKDWTAGLDTTAPRCEVW